MNRAATTTGEFNKFKGRAVMATRAFQYFKKKMGFGNIKNMIVNPSK